ncbi:hypothetical protein AB1Y20_017791 [Prymnesium parvum]|uniref:PiggyBac transposable element-derived protein domain-containing protein n=1 Tax=Prymnesium parvum TaxID=97485 RepID=A0AB34JNI3_PRYPA
MAGRGRGRGASGAPIPFQVDDDPVTNWRAHPIGIIIASHDPPADITFTIKADFCRYKRYDLPQDMEEVTEAHIRRWVRKEDGALTISWHVDEKDSTELLEELLMPCFNLKLIKFHNAPRKAIPTAHGGATARRDYARAISTGPYAHLFRAINRDFFKREEEQHDISITFKDSGTDRTIVWKKQPPQHVQQDWRPGGRERLCVKGGPRGLGPGQYNTLEKVLFNLAIPDNLVDFLLDCVNDRLTGDKSKGARLRSCTKGEILRFFGYMGAITLNQEEPVDRMWRKEHMPGDVCGPPAMGRHGMSKDRFDAIRAALSKPFRLDESGLDPTDGHRYVRPMLDLFNAHREKSLVPSWLLVLDELEMCQAGFGFKLGAA